MRASKPNVLSMNEYLMNLSLPEIIQFQQVCGHESAWADHYGALFVAGQYCGVSIPPLYRFPHVWQHGCTGPWHEEAETIICNVPDAKNKKIFVARKQEEEILQEAGYSKAKAIGIAMAYLPPVPVDRTSESLLIMPQHTLVGMKRGSEEQRRAYIDSLKPYLSRFGVVVACISPSCIANGYFVKEFQEIGVEVIPGALTSDINALLRMQCMMNQFDYMTTNGWGTHLAYALHFGMKVSVFGDYFKVPDDEVLKDTTWATMSPEKRSSFRDKSINGSIEFVEQLRSEPHEGVTNIKLGQWLIGADNKVSPLEMKELFEW
jgi:hypothetical protein